MFSRKACYFFVRPKKTFLEVCIFLGRTVKAPQVRKAVRSSSVKVVHVVRLTHRDEVEAPVTDWLEEAYDVSDQPVGKEPRRKEAEEEEDTREETPGSRLNQAVPEYVTHFRGALMGLTDFIRSQFIDIIEWTDDSRDTLSYRFPDEDKEIKSGAQLIVRESQAVQFVYLGQYGDLFGPGKHTLTTDNIPILTRLKGWKYGFESPFKADVYYLTTRLFTGNKWGTSNPVMMRDQDFGIVRVRAFGTYDFRIVDPPKFLKEVAGTDNHFRLDEFADVMRSRIVSVFSEALATSKVPVLDVATRYSELGEALLPLINPVLKEKYGLEMASFVVENVSVPPEVEAGDRQAVEHGGGRQPERLREVPDGAGAREGRRGRRRHRRGDGRRHVDRAADDEPAGRHHGAGHAGRRRAGRRRRPASRKRSGPADAAKVLGVSEADVIASLEAGDLKGKQIGTQWRITKTAHRRLPEVGRRA